MGDYRDDHPDGSPLGAHESGPTGEASLQSERWLGMMRQSTPDVVSIIGGDGTVRYVSPNVERVFGYQPQELVGTLPVHHVHRGDRALVQKSFAEASEKPGISPSVRFRARAADGSWRHVEAILTNLLDDPDIRGFVVSVRDVTGEKRVEEQIRRSRERFKAQYKGFPIPTYSWRKVDEDFVLVDFNDAAHDFTEGGVVGLLGRKATELWPEEPVVVETMIRCFEEKTTQELETPWMLLSTGERKHLVVSCVFVPPDMVMVHTQDVTEQKKAEERLRLQADLLAAVGQAVIATDRQGMIVYWNRAAEELYGWSAEEAMGRSGIEATAPKDLWGRADEIMSELRAMKSWSGEYELRRKDGTLFHAMITITSVLDDQDNLVGITGVTTDITELRRAQERLRETEEKYRTLVEQIPAVTYIDRADGSDEPLYTSPHIEEMLGYTPEEWLEGRLWSERLHPEDRERVLAADEHFESGGSKEFSEEYRLIAKDGSVVWVREEAVLVEDERGNPLFWQGILHDITERKEAEEALKQGEAQLAEAQRMAHVGSWEWDVASNALAWSDELYRIFGRTPEEFENTYESFLRYVHPEDRQFVQETIQKAYETGQPFAFEHRLVRPDGGVRILHARGEVFTNENGERVRMSGISQDVTERKALEEQLQHLAFHDQLTGRPNRHLFMDRLGHALERTRRRRGNKAAVLFMDLDDFKVVNDSLGHGVGNMLLVAVAERLGRCLRPVDTLARFGGDEFVVLLEDVMNPEDALRVAERITEELRRPFTLAERQLFVAASIGIALGDARAKAPEDLLRDADTAMYRAKEERLGYKVFDEAMYERAISRLELESDLRSAMERGELALHYQPMINLQTGGLWGLEALVRWDHPRRGLLDPSEFMPIAEQSGLVISLGQRVLREACRQMKEWQEEYPHAPPLTVSVNLSVRQLGNSDLADAVEGVLRETQLEASWLCLDITESAYVQSLEGNTATTLDRLRAMGVKISIDDFGMGYSSLAYLKRLPADTLKIDKSFVKGLGEDVEDTAIVQMVIELAHTLGMEVIAEGVEDWGQASLLEEMGCDFGQGYHFSKPLPPEEVPMFLAEEGTS
jgi:diguanylate cyclase (GGDEF)-like protein/PAS domain S-box-containing protein